MFGKILDFNSSLTLLTLNTRGMQNETKRKKQFAWLRNQKIKISFLQETHSSPSKKNIWKNQWNGDMYCAHGTSNSKGVAILFSRDIQVKCIQKYGDEYGRYLWLLAEIEGMTMEFLNIYAPNKRQEQHDFYEKLSVFLREKHQTHIPIVIGGDFNVILDPNKDKHGGNMQDKQRDSIAQQLKHILEEHSLTDIWRAKNYHNEEFTWSQLNPPVFCRLDMWFIPKEWIQITENAHIITAVGTDHRGVKITLQGSKFTPRGPGYWKLNNSILKEQDYINGIRKTIKETEEKYNDWEDSMFWGFLKYEIRAFTQKYCKNRARVHRDQEKILLQRLQAIEKTLHELNENEVNEYKKCKEAYEKIYENKAKGALTRSRANWIAEGEKNTKYFMSLEKHNYTTTCIKQIMTDNNGIEEDNNRILDKIQQHFANSYSTEDLEKLPKPPKLEEFIEPQWLPKIDDNEKVKLAEPITINEITNAVNSMKLGSAPGLDGLTVDFYHTFWDELSPYLFKMYNFCYEMGTFRTTTSEGVIRLIPKPGKNPLHVENWRPISLLNVDYKIYSKALAIRLEKIVQKLIHRDQAGFVKGRYIGESIRTILDVIETCDEKKIHGLMVNMDIQRAFDKIRWENIHDMFSLYGIPEQFLNLMSLLFNNSTSSVINNGYLTSRFKIHRGVRQGDCASPLIFVLAFELLAIAIRHNPRINGIDIEGLKFRVVQFADDTTVFLKDENSLLELEKLMETYHLISGMKVNIAKTTVMGIGEWKNKSGKIGSFSLTTQPVKVLGIWYSYSKEEMYRLNVENKLDKLKNTLKSWHARNLTIQGKILVLKVLGLSQLVYPFTNLVIKEETLKEVDKICKEYIWNGKHKVKIKRAVMIQSYEKGGMKSPDIFTMYKTWKYSWLVRLSKMESCPWKKLITNQLNKLGGLEYLAICNFDSAAIISQTKQTTIFFTELLENYENIFKITITENTTNKTINDQIINNNRYITKGRTSFYNKKLMEYNIDSVKDWIQPDGSPYSFQEMRSRCNELNQMEYNQIISAIPRQWKKILKNEQNWTLDDEEIPPLGHLSKNQIKDKLYNRQAERPVGPAVWNRITKQNPKTAKSFWEKAFLNARKTVKESKMQVLQFKILHRILPCKKFLQERKLIEDAICETCQKVETLEHMLFECQRIKQLWNETADWYEALEQFTIPININTCILNVHKKPRKKLTRENKCKQIAHYYRWNFIALHLKQHIYYCNIAKQIPTFNGFVPKLKQKLMLIIKGFSYTAEKDMFCDTWSKFLPKI